MFWQCLDSRKHNSKEQNHILKEASFHTESKASRTKRDSERIQSKKCDKRANIQDDYQNLLNLQATFVSSWKDVEMKRRAGILKTDRSEEETERNPYTYLHDYHSSSELSSMQSFVSLIC